MAEVIAIDGNVWNTSPLPHVRNIQHVNRPAMKRCGSLQEQYAAFCAAQEALGAEQAMLVRLPKAKDEIAPSGFIALKTLTQTSAGQGMRPQCHGECAALLDGNEALAAIMAWLEQMPGNWGNEMVLQALHDPRSGQSVIGIRLKNIILFRSSLHALEAKLGASLLALVEDGARIVPAQAIAEVFDAHNVDYAPYQVVISGPW